MISDAAARAATAMHNAERDAMAVLRNSPGRSKGLPEAKPGAPEHWYNWLVASTSPDQEPIASRDGMFSATAHQQIAIKAVCANVARAIAPARSALGESFPPMGRVGARLSFVVPMAANGDFGRPYWTLLRYALRGMFPPNAAPNKGPMAILLHELEGMGHGDHRYMIGNKTLWADSPQGALLQHVRLTAPKTPIAKRKAPANLGQIHRIWANAESKVLLNEALDARKRTA